MTQSTEKERAEFEAWLNPEYSKELDGAGGYIDDTVYSMFAAWKAARRAPVVPQDPMDWPLPCDVTVGHGTVGKGVKLRTLVLRMKALYKLATGNDADEVEARNPAKLHEMLRKLRVSAKRDGELGRDSARTEEIEREVMQLLAAQEQNNGKQT